MTEELYDRQEKEVALEALGALSAALPEPFVVMGGWAVYQRHFNHPLMYLASE